MTESRLVGIWDAERGNQGKITKGHEEFLNDRNVHFMPIVMVSWL